MKTFSELGDFEILRNISKIFYDKVYAHPWLGNFFKSVRQEVIERQQVDFMAQALGGPQNYGGRGVVHAHEHINITPEVFKLRQEILNEAFAEAGACPELIERWLKIENAFRHALQKESLADCKKRFATDEILDFAPNGGVYKKAA